MDCIGENRIHGWRRFHAFGRFVGQTRPRGDFEWGAGVYDNAIGSELLPVRQLLVDCPRRKLGGARQPVPNLLIRRATVLIERPQTKSKQNNAR